MIINFDNLDKIIDFYIHKKYSNINPINKYDDIYIFCDKNDLSMWDKFFGNNKIDNNVVSSISSEYEKTLQYRGYNINLKLI